MKTVMHCAASLCALLLLSACGAMRQPLVRTELVEVPVTQYAPLPAALTEPLPAPAMPPRNCFYKNGTPAVCALDGLIWAVHWQAFAERANDDRTTARKVSGTTNLMSRDAKVLP